ncbi:MAG: V-type ATPase subunit [Treponema sp.]|jgi:vacuolar-type H+-ATPase subunit C/Vma6|nr:V-type ATPase subunit [Treponema sp.]
MPAAGERAYVYAKACGIIGKSFTGKRIPRLRAVTRLSELERLIFPAPGRELPGRELLKDLETRITGRAVKQILAIVDSFSRPPELLIRLLRAYEYSDLKTCLNLAGSGEREAPAFTGIGRFRTLRAEAFPDIDAMIRDTEFAFLLEKAPVLRGGDTISAQTALDRHYYAGLWESLGRIPAHDRRAAEKILGEEISLRNCAWALRLRTYYGMEAGEGREHLLDIPLKSGVSAAADAEAALELPLDSRSAWKGWSRESFLNGENPGGPWKADPRFFQNRVSNYLYRLALRLFRRRPFSLDTAFCFIKLKQFEEDLLISVAEGLGMGMPGGDIFAVLEVEP